MKLIGSNSSPYTRKCRVVLSEKRIDYDFVIDPPSDPATRVPEYNPLGKVPVLVLDDDSTVFDSRVIVEYLDTISPVSRLLPEPGRQRIAVRRWEALADGILDAAVSSMQELRRPEGERSAAWLERQRCKIDRALEFCARDLGDRLWCHDDGFGLADIALGCALGYLDFRFPEIGWRAEWPGLLRHFEKLSRRPSFEATIPS